jgi:hypothetical protein
VSKSLKEKTNNSMTKLENIFAVEEKKVRKNKDKRIAVEAIRVPGDEYVNDAKEILKQSGLPTNRFFENTFAYFLQICVENQHEISFKDKKFVILNLGGPRALPHPPVEEEMENEYLKLYEYYDNRYENDEPRY